MFTVVRHEKASRPVVGPAGPSDGLQENLISHAFLGCDDAPELQPT